MEGIPGTVSDRSKPDLKESDNARKLRKRRASNRRAQQKFRDRRKENETLKQSFAMPSPSNIDGVQYPMAHPAAVTTQVGFPIQTSSNRSATEQPNDDREYQPGGPGPAGASLRNDYRVPPQVSQLDRSPAAQNRQSQWVLHYGVQPRQNSEPRVTPRPVPGHPYANTSSPQDKIPDSDNSSKPTIRFEPLPHRYTVLDRYERPAKSEVTAQIYGKFYFSGTGGDDTFICYRRNNFRILGSVKRPAGPLSVVNRGERMAIVSQEMTVSATESMNQNNVRLIVATRKKIPLATPLQEHEPSSIPIADLYNGDEAFSSVLQQPTIIIGG